MKTAISIPDPLFNAAEKVAQKMDISRSELYATAVSEYLALHSGKSITARINVVMANETNELDPVMEQLQYEALRHSPWED